MEALFQQDLVWLFIFILVAFIAGYIDAIAGGGGMLMVPTLLLGGLSPVVALATTKFTSMIGTCFVVLKYARHRLVVWRIVFLVVIPCTIAAVAGSILALITPDWLMEIAILVTISVALFVSIYVKPNPNVENENGKEQNKGKLISWLSSIGFYDGFAGPGTGTFLVLANNRITGHNLVVSIAISKPINLMTNLGASIMFISAGKVMWSVAIPMLIANSIGGWVGGHVAILKGSEFIKKLLVYILVAMLAVNVGHMFM